MDILITSEHRFLRTPDGTVWTGGIHAYEVALRYLSVFDGVKVLARVLDVDSVDIACQRASGPGVRFVPIPYYVGPRQLLAKSSEVRRAVESAVRPGDAVILRVSSYIADRLESVLAACGHPYALEVVNDPWEVFAPGAVAHVTRPILRRWFTWRLRQQCRRAAAVSYVTERTLQKRYPSPAYSVGVSDVELPAEALRERPCEPREKTSGPYRLITVASLEMMYKAPDVLVRTVAELVRAGLDIELDIVGDGRLRPALERMAEELGVRGRVFFRGQVPAREPVRRHLDVADLFVLSSRTEGLPRAMVEAMARALPCIGSNVGGIPELLPPEDLVPANDPRALASKVREVLSRPGRMSEMSARNLARAHDFADTRLAARRREFLLHVRQATTDWSKGSRVPAVWKNEAPVW